MASGPTNGATMAAAFSVSFDLMQQSTSDAPWMSRTSVLLGPERALENLSYPSAIHADEWPPRAACADQHDLMARAGQHATVVAS